MTKKLFNFILAVSTILSLESSWAEDIPDSREFSERFKNEILPELHLKEKSARNAIDELGKLEFQCALVGEQKNLLYPSKPLKPFVHCTRLMVEKNRLYALLWVGLFIKDWAGDGTPLAMRFDQLATSEVNSANVTNFSYQDNRDTPASKAQSVKLDQILVIAASGQTIQEFSKNAMTRDFSCRAFEKAIECIANNPTPICSLASVRIEVSEGKNDSAPLSLWSTDRQIKEQGQWTCLSLRNAP